MIIQNGGRKARKTNSKRDYKKMGKKQSAVPEDVNKEQGIMMDAIIQFELKEVKIIDEKPETA